MMTNKIKTFGLCLFSLLVLAVIGELASAASLTVGSPNFPASVSHDQGSFDFSFQITNIGVADPAIGFSLLMTSGDATLTMSNVAIAEGSSVTPVAITVTGTINFPAYQSAALVGKIIVDDSGQGGPKNVEFSVPITNDPSIKLTKKQSITKSLNGTIEVENNGNVAWHDIELTSSGDFDVDFYDSNHNLIDTGFSVASGEKKTVTVAPTTLGDVGFGGKSVTITATADDDTTKATVTMDVMGSFCEVGTIGGNLEITKIGIDNTGAGKDGEWNLLDTVEVEVKIENNGNEDLEDIIVEMGFFDSSGKDKVSDLDFDTTDEEQYDLGDLDEGDDETVTFKFIVPADLDDGNYKLAIKAYSDKSGEDEQCVDTSDEFDTEDKYMKISVERESDDGKFIAFDNIEFTPTGATCGDSVTMDFDVYNIGDKDQDQVRINLENSELGISKSVEIRNDLNQGDKESIIFDFVIPQNVANKVYTLKLSSDYDYKNGNYRQSSDDDKEVSLTVLGCGPSSGGTTEQNIVVINAVLDSGEASAGNEFTVRATITNLKSEQAALVVDAYGYQSWASLDDISPRIVDLAGGASRDVVFTFTADEDASGEEAFEIEVRDSAGNIQTREVGVNIEGTSAGVTGFDFGQNGFLWIIGIINVVLIVLIIIVAVRVARR